jgi:ABC-type sugar transport system substrate-binding protein
MIKKGSIRARMLGGLAVVALVAVACSSSGASTAPSAGATGSRTIAANGGGVGNGWRESSICSVKAQAVKSGNVSNVTVIHHDTDAAGQLTDIRDLIAKDVDAIIINPNDPDALNPAIDEAIKAGIKVVAIDAFVTAKGAYNLSNDQIQYAYLGAKGSSSSGRKGMSTTWRHRRPPGRHRPRHRLQEGPCRVSRHHGRQGGRDQVGSRDRRQPDQRHHEQRRAVRRRLDLRR